MYSSTATEENGALFHAEPNARASYRREFEEMENRILRCERQRAELERQFEDLMRERADCEKAAVRAMKQRQRRQMEVERQRTERNESILRMLNKIDQQAASLAAKTDRLKMLKTQYEMYLMRTWSTPAQALPSYSVPMIMAPPVMHTKLPQSPQKSGFVQYLNELTNQQTTSINCIPPPTALSNYISSQQKPFTLDSSNGTGPPERPYSRALNVGLQEETTMMHYGASGAQMAAGGSKANKFEMSNEDFIRYIDSEVLKEPIPKVSIIAPSPVVEVAEKKQTGAAYLEDATMSEDEPIGDLSNKLKEFSMMVDAESKKDTSNNTAKERSVDETHQLGEVVENASETIVAENEDHSSNEPPLDEILNEDCEVIAEKNSKIGHKNQGSFDHDVQEGQTDSRTSGMDIPHEDPEHTLARDEISQDLRNTAHHELVNPSNDVVYEPTGPNVDYLEGSPRTDENVYNTVQSQGPLYDDQQYSASNDTLNPETASELNVQQLQEPIEQSATRNQHWTTARQALRSKALPVVSSKPPSPETDLQEQGEFEGQHETITTVAADIGNIDQEIVQSSPVQNDPPNNEYPAYSVEANDPYYQTDASGVVHPSTEQMQTPVSQGYHNDAMGQPVEYHQGDTQQAAAYQYENNQEGQYIAGTEESQYQYQEVADPTSSTYATQEGYQDPNQQYQYDENAQYYSDQQAYDAQYYSQDPQHQQQYYMGDPHQQQEAGQYEQQMDQPNQEQQQQIEPTDQYPTVVETNGQAAFYPSEKQYDPAIHNPEQIEPVSGTATGDDPQVVEEQTTVDTSAVIDATLVKDKQEKKAADASPQQLTVEQKPSRKEADPGSDVPTLSTVNDESDFDFSSQ
uniref:Uncharacterized protein n=1 Tax=Anopheles minimus TaxID=112268 RepID=A0A182VQF4_9DIPT